MNDHVTEVGTDPGTDQRPAGERSTARAGVWDVTLTIAVGGALGAVARYAIGTAWPHGPDAFPWATFAINAAGCLLIGALMALLTEVAGRPHRLVRPFLGVGVLGGFTTFSTYTVDAQHLISTGHTRLALAYLFGTVAAALAAAQLGIVATRLLTRPRTRKGTRP